MDEIGEVYLIDTPFGPRMKQNAETIKTNDQIPALWLLFVPACAFVDQSHPGTSDRKTTWQKQPV